jgi:hypothetical protein
VLALLAVPMLRVAPTVGSAAAASGYHNERCPVPFMARDLAVSLPFRSLCVADIRRARRRSKGEGKGYQSREQVNIYYKTNFHLPKPKMVLVCTTSATSKGKFNCSGHFPTKDSGALGSHEIQAIGQTSGTVA